MSVYLTQPGSKPFKVPESVPNPVGVPRRVPEPARRLVPDEPARVPEKAFA